MTLHLHVHPPHPWYAHPPPGALAFSLWVQLNSSYTGNGSHFVYIYISLSEYMMLPPRFCKSQVLLLLLRVYGGCRPSPGSARQNTVPTSEHETSFDYTFGWCAGNIERSEWSQILFIRQEEHNRRHLASLFLYNAFNFEERPDERARMDPTGASSGSRFDPRGHKEAAQRGRW